MNFNIFNFTDYKLYLSEKITHEASLHKGYRAKLCEFIQCQPSYLSQVLNGKPDFTLEQAHRLNQFLLHDKIETHFFILLVEKSRAGTRDLRAYFNEQIENVKSSRFNLKKRLKETDDISEEDQNKYYSAWFYSAIYVALSIPEFQSIQFLAKRLSLPEELIVEAISFLETSGLIEKKSNTYHVTKKRIHLERDSAFIRRHHVNWRSQALQSTEKNLPGDLHFSTVVALAKDDYEKIKEIFVKSIASAREVIKPSPEEELMAITLDVFKL